MDAVEALEALELLGADQWGLVTTSQSRENGISRLWMQRLYDRGVLQRLRHGVYALPSSRPGALRDVQAAWLSVTAGASFQGSESDPLTAVVSGATAAAVYEIGDLVPPYLEISVPYARMTKQRDLRLIHRDLPTEDVDDLDGLPVTTVERTIYDLSVAATDLDHFTTLVVDAARRPDANAEKLSKSLETRAVAEGHRSGQVMLKEMLATRGLDIDSVGQKSDPFRQFSEFITASVDPKVLKNLSTSVSNLLKAQGNPSSSELAQAWSTAMKERMPDLSAISANLLKTATLQASNDHHHDNEQDEG